jgi:Tfp pilus assembly protein PilX
MRHPSRPSAHPRRRPDRRGEDGSVYLIVLFLLILVTVFGLSLAVITQTEAQIGASERTATRNFYTADSGIGYSLARKQVTNLEASRIFDAVDSTTSAISGINLANRVALSPLATVAEAPCNLCSINDRQGEEFKQIEYVLNSTAERRAKQGTDDATLTTIAFKQLSMIVGRQPATSSIGALMEINGDESVRKSIRY